MFRKRRKSGKLPIIVTVTYMDGKVEQLMFHQHAEHLAWQEEVFENYKKGIDNIRFVRTEHASF